MLQRVYTSQGEKIIGNQRKTYNAYSGLLSTMSSQETRKFQNRYP